MAKKTRAERKKHSSGAPVNSANTTRDNELMTDSLEESEGIELTEDFDDDGSFDSVDESKSHGSTAKAEISDDRAERLKRHIEKQNKKKQQKERQATGKAAHKPSKAPKFIQKIITYFSNVRAEMKRVVWPTKQETLRLSLVVLFALVFFGVFIFLVDSGVVPVLEAYSSLGG